MTTDRQVRLSPEELALKLATRDARRAAGGQQFLALHLGKAQSRLSDYESPNTRDFIPLNDAIAVEMLGHGDDGHPHITRKMAELQGYLLVKRPEGLESHSSIARGIIVLQQELGDLAACVSESLEDGDLSDDEIAEAQRELLELEEAAAAVRLRLDRLGKPPAPNDDHKVKRIREA